MKKENPYLEYDKEELEFLLENENEIETGCPIPNDQGCIDEEIKLIKMALAEKYD